MFSRFSSLMPRNFYGFFGLKLFIAVKHSKVCTKSQMQWKKTSYLIKIDRMMMALNLFYETNQGNAMHQNNFQFGFNESQFLSIFFNIFFVAEIILVFSHKFLLI